MKTTTLPTAVGIDVAKATLSVCVLYPDGKEHALTFRNIDTDINKKLLPSLYHYTGKVVMESTGHYHWKSAMILKEAGCDVRVVNPLLAKQYTAGNIRKVKNDPIDAQSLARMARVADNPPSSFSDTPESLWMRKKLGLLASLNKHVQGINSTLSSTEEAQGIVSGEDSAVVTEIKETVKTLRLTMTKLEKECVRETMKDPVLKEKMKLLATVPGLSPFVSALYLHWFTDESVKNPKSWIAYAGLDISVRESGTWRGKCRLTKRGNAYLRKRLFSSAWGAWMNDPQFKAYYDELKEEGRPHTECLLILARKIVRISFMVLKNNTPYDATKCFSPTIPALTI